MLHAHILGIAHTDRNIRRQNPAFQLGVKADVREVIDTQTIDEVIDKYNIDETYIRALEKRLEEKAATMARLDFYDRMEALQGIISENIKTGLGKRDFINRLGRNKAMSEIGIAGENPYYIETVYRTNYGSAHSAGKWKAAQESNVVTMLEYMVVDDDRNTDICDQLRGTRLPKTDPFWSTYHPLNHFS
jgi:SPP1 gp7 family putative phage head morphogenesis protein